MTIQQLSIDNNYTDAAATAANMDATSVIAVGAIVKYSESRTPLPGFTKSFRVAATASGSAYAYLALPDGSTMVSFSMYVYFDTLPTADYSLFWVTDTADTPARAANVLITAAGMLRLQPKGSAVWTGTVEVPTGKWVRLAGYMTMGSAGKMRIAMYDGNSTTPLSDSGEVTADTGTVPFGGLRMGKASTNAYVGTVDHAAMRYSWDTAALMAVPVADTPAPTLVLSTKADYFFIDARGSTKGGTGALSYGITPSTGTFEIAEGAFLVPRGAADVVYTVRVTEAGTGKYDQTPTITVPALVSGSSGSGIEKLVFINGVWQ